MYGAFAGLCYNHMHKCDTLPSTLYTLANMDVYYNSREQQLRNRQLTESEGDSSGLESRRTTTRGNSRRRGVAPPIYSLIDTGSELTTDSEFETEAETSLSEPEYTEHEPDLSPPPYSP